MKKVEPTATGVSPFLPISSPRLSGPNNLSDAPLTADDWRIIHHAYMAFMTTVRRVAQQAYGRHQPAAATAEESER